jgi:hypothetical protein
VQLGQQPVEVDPSVQRRVGGQASNCLVELSLRRDGSSAACLIPGDGDVDESLVEVPLLGGRSAPDVLEHLVRGEVLAPADQLDACFKP